MHSEITMIMSGALDGEASETELRILHDHLALCSECQATWERWRGLDRLFSREPQVSAPLGFADLVMARVEQVGHSREAALARRRKILGALFLFIGCAILPALVATAWCLDNPREATLIFDAGRGFFDGLGYAVRGLDALLLSAGGAPLAILLAASSALTSLLVAVWIWAVVRGPQMATAGLSVRGMVPQA